MKKDDELLEGRLDEEEDLFDLSLDDLEPEDTIVEPHMEEPDDEIIELIDLVEKGDIDLGEEVMEPSAAIFTDSEDKSEENIDDLKIDETLDLLDIPLDEEISFDELEEEEQEEVTGEGIISANDLKFFVEDDLQEETVETPMDLFVETPPEQAFEEPIIDKSNEEPEIEGLLEIDIADITSEEPEPEREKTIRLYPEEKKSPEPVQEIIAEEQELLPDVSLEAIQPEQEPELQQALISQTEEAPQAQADNLPGISEEKIEAIVRKVVEEVVERVAGATMASVAEKYFSEARKEEVPQPVVAEISDEKVEAILKRVEETVERVAKETVTGAAEKIIADSKKEEASQPAVAEISDEKIETILRRIEETVTGAAERIIADTKKEETPPAAETPIGISDEKIEAMLRKIVEEVVDRAARETMTSVAQKIITDAISALQRSIESASA